MVSSKLGSIASIFRLSSGKFLEDLLTSSFMHVAKWWWYPMGSAGVLSAVSRHEGQTFWKNFVYWVCVVYIKGRAHTYNVDA